MFDDILGFGRQCFTVLVLLISAGISAHICYGYGTKRTKEAFISLILILIVGVQMYHLINAATYIPATRFYTFNDELHRTDCIESGKGGKRPDLSTLVIDRHPCFCQSSILDCIDSSSGVAITNGSCPIDGTATCISSTQKFEAYLSRLRDCRGGQGKYCTIDQPCHPCELDKIVEFGSERCRSCSSDVKSDCTFIPGKGPYCLKSAGSKQVVPCKKCCTEPEPLIINGTCY